MPFKSIRWQLPLSYAAIALLAALALGLALILPLRSTYAQLEREHLNRNAREIGQVISEVLQSGASDTDANTQAQALAFLTQARVRMFDSGRRLILDSGPVAPRSVLALPHLLNTPARPARPNPSSSEIMFPAGASAPVMTYTAPFTDSFDLEVDRRRIALPGDVLFAIVVDDAFSTATGPGVGVTPGQRVTETRMIVNRSLYGFDFNPEARFDERRSDQVVEQPYVNDAGQLLGYVELSEGPAYGRDIVENVARGWAIASAVAVLIAAGTGFLISRRISAPLIALTSVTARMAQGELSARADVRRDDELGILAQSFNEMAERVEGTVTTLRQFVSDAAHEVNTPLTALRTRLDLAERDTNLAHIHEAREQVTRLEQLASGLLDLSRIESGTSGATRSALDLLQLVRATSEPFASRAEQRGVMFTLDLPDGPMTMLGDENQLRRAVSNLLDNAVKFTQTGGTVRLSLREDKSSAVLVVEDDGIGIPPNELPQLFNRFHRASNAAGYAGNGLGLSIVKAIVEAHGGDVHAESAAGRTRFMLRLPLRS